MANISGPGVSITAMVSTQHTCELCPQVDVELPFLGALQGCLQEALKATSQQMKAGDADRSQLILELPPGWKIPLCAITRTGPK